MLWQLLPFVLFELLPLMLMTHNACRTTTVLVVHTCLIDQQQTLHHTPAAAVMGRQKDNQQGPAVRIGHGSAVSRATLGDTV